MRTPSAPSAPPASSATGGAASTTGRPRKSTLTTTSNGGVSPTRASALAGAAPSPNSASPTRAGAHERRLSADRRQQPSEAMKRQLQQMAAAGPVTGSQGSQAAGVSKPGSSGVRSQAGESEGGRSGISSAMTSNYGYGGGASAYSGRGWEERNRFGEPTASTESLSMGPAKVFYETQQISPAPGQTHFQLAIELPRSNPTAPRVVLRDWPRQRMSQRWTRGGSLNPGQTTMTMAEFLDGEMEEKLVWIFGKSEYDKAVREGMRCVEEQGKEAEAASREKSRGTVKGGSVISGSSRS